MRSMLLRMVGCLALGSALFPTGVWAAEATTSTAATMKTTIDSTLHVRAIVLKSLIEFRWKRYPKPKEFRYYELIRFDPDQEVILATTTNRYSTNGMDPHPRNGKNDYRLCIRRKDDSRVCTKLMKETFKGPEARVLGVVDPSPGAIQKTSVTYPISNDVFMVTPGMSAGMVSWPAPSEIPDYWKVVQSTTNLNPQYGVDGYVQHLPDSSLTSAVLKFPIPRQWLRICAVKEDQWIRCSNVYRVP